MKNLQFILFILIPVLMIGQNNIYPGMHIDEFRKEMPDKIPPLLPFNETLTLEDEINNVKGKWVFQFSNDKLRDIKFRSNHYYLSWPLDASNGRNEKMYQQSSVDAAKVFSHFKEKYGPPLNTTKVQLQLDPDKANYSELLQIDEWSLSGMKLNVEYKFEGDNREIIAVSNSDKTMYSYYIHINILPNKGGTADHKEKFFIGMDIKDFSKNFPNILPSGVTENGRFGFKETIHELKGSWYYHFENDSLETYGYTAYIKEELNKENFDLCLNAAEKLIEKYIGIYGEPTELNIGDKTFKDPDIKRHWGYDVVEAKWKDEQKKFRIEFQFFGGKGDYFFLVKAEAYKPDYEYFD